MKSNVTMPFGKHRGRSLDEIPTSYLLWVLDNVETLQPSLREAIQRFLNGTTDEEISDAYNRGFHDGLRRAQRGSSAPSGVLRERICDWHRRAALRFHPDHGGDVRLMQTVNELKDTILSVVEHG